MTSTVNESSLISLSSFTNVVDLFTCQFYQHCGKVCSTWDDKPQKKIWNPKQKKFFSLQTWRPAKSFDGLNSSLAQSAEELCYR